MAGQAKQQVQILVMQGAQMTLASAAGYSATLTSMLRPVLHLQASVAQPHDRRALFVNPAKQLDDEAMKKSAAAAQQLGSVIGDPASIGAKLMSKMGFGVAGQGLGRAGQVRYAPSRSSRARAKYSLRSAHAPAGITSGTLICCPFQVQGVHGRAKLFPSSNCQALSGLQACCRLADFVSRHIVGSSYS